jgi:hypothetical protein
MATNNAGREIIQPTGVATSPRVQPWSGGLTVEADSLAAALRVVAAHPLAGDTGPLMVHGHRTAAGRASVIVRLAEPRIRYDITSDGYAMLAERGIR